MLQYGISYHIWQGIPTLEVQLDHDKTQTNDHTLTLPSG